MPALTVAITGGIGSGKSAVLEEFQTLGAVVIDSDEIARDVVRTGSVGFDAVRAAFSAAVVGPDGALDRTRLAEIVFADTGARARLEAIVHPLVRAETRRLIVASDPAAIVVNAVPLLVEADLAGEYDAVVAVSAPVDTRLKRLLESRGMSREQGLARMAAQASDDDRARVASWVIVNDGTIEELRNRVRELWPAVTARAAGS